jgi:hypothetical protein
LKTQNRCEYILIYFQICQSCKFLFRFRKSVFNPVTSVKYSVLKYLKISKIEPGVSLYQPMIKTKNFRNFFFLATAGALHVIRPVTDEINWIEVQSSTAGHLICISVGAGVEIRT